MRRYLLSVLAVVSIMTFLLAGCGGGGGGGQKTQLNPDVDSRFLGTWDLTHMSPPISAANLAGDAEVQLWQVVPNTENQNTVNIAFTAAGSYTGKLYSIASDTVLSQWKVAEDGSLIDPSAPGKLNPFSDEGTYDCDTENLVLTIESNSQDSIIAGTYSYKFSDNDKKLFIKDEEQVLVFAKRSQDSSSGTPGAGNDPGSGGEQEETPLPQVIVDTAAWYLIGYQDADCNAPLPVWANKAGESDSIAMNANGNILQRVYDFFSVGDNWQTRDVEESPINKTYKCYGNTLRVKDSKGRTIDYSFELKNSNEELWLSVENDIYVYGKAPKKLLLPAALIGSWHFVQFKELSDTELLPVWSDLAGNSYKVIFKDDGTYSRDLLQIVKVFGDTAYQINCYSSDDYTKNGFFRCYGDVDGRLFLEKSEPSDRDLYYSYELKNDKTELWLTGDMSEVIVYSKKPPKRPLPPEGTWYLIKEKNFDEEGEPHPVSSDATIIFTENGKFSATPAVCEDHMTKGNCEFFDVAVYWYDYDDEYGNGSWAWVDSSYKLTDLGNGMKELQLTFININDDNKSCVKVYSNQPPAP